MINFKTVSWKNFLSTGNTSTEIELDKNNTTLIVGENGAGKSTILDALCFGLFGKPFRIISKNLLVNTINASSTEVIVTFNIGTRQWKVIRGIKPTKFQIYCDDRLVNQDANSRDYQKYLEQTVLHLNYRSFTQVVILGSSSFVPFMQLKARHRREVVEEILDIKVFSLMNFILKGKIKELSEQLKDLDYEFKLFIEKIALQSNYIDDLKANKDKILEEKYNSFAKNEDKISEREADKNDLVMSNTFLEKECYDKDEIEKMLLRLKNDRADIAAKHKQISHEENFFRSNQSCPTCYQDISEEHKENMIKEKEKSIKEIISDAKDLKLKLDNADARLSEINKVLKKIRENEIKQAELHSSISELKRYNNTLNKEIEDFQKGSVSESDIDKLDALKTDCKKLEERRSEVKEEIVYTNAVKDMLSDSGIKTKIIKQYLPIMNQLINKYLVSMEFYVNFNLDENFEETIKSRYRDEFTYASFSEGEKMRIDLALLFTWRAIAKMKNSVSTNLLILDEIFDSSLDGQGTDEFLKILNTLGDENVFVISHKGDQLADKFRNTIKFEKIRNFSHVSK